MDLERVRVPLDEISLARPTSGWRDVDWPRIQEIKSLCYQGQLSMNVFGGVVLLKGCTDVDGKQLIDDGMSTVMAWVEMKKEYSQDPDNSPSTELGGGEPWDPNVIEVFNLGLVVSQSTYEDNGDVSLREAWNAAKHDEENNKYRPTSLAKKISIVNSRWKRVKDYSKVTAELLEIYGKGKYSTVQRWVRTLRIGNHTSNLCASRPLRRTTHPFPLPPLCRAPHPCSLLGRTQPLCFRALEFTVCISGFETLQKKMCWVSLSLEDCEEYVCALGDQTR